jgi:hypothetical protein
MGRVRDLLVRSLSLGVEIGGDVPKEGLWPGGRQPIPTRPLLRHGALAEKEDGGERARWDPFGANLARPESREPSDPHEHGTDGDGRYWARTSDPQLVELVLAVHLW